MTSSTRPTYHRPCLGAMVSTGPWPVTLRWIESFDTKGTFGFSVTAFFPCLMAVFLESVNQMEAISVYLGSHTPYRAESVWRFECRNLPTGWSQAFMAGNDHRGVCRESLAEVNQNEKISWDEFLKMMQSPKVLGLRWSTDDSWSMMIPGQAIDSAATRP